MASIWVGGFHIVEVLLARHPERILQLVVDRERSDRRMMQAIDSAEKQGIAVNYGSANTLDGVLAGVNHQGVAAKARAAEERSGSELAAFVGTRPRPLLLLLDRVQDPRNLGACLRTAEAAGVDALILPRKHAAPLSAAARKVASGAAELVPVFRVANLAASMNILKEAGVWLVGTSDAAPGSLYDTELPESLAVVMGGESRGLRRRTREQCDLLVRLPMAGAIPSLNVSVATGITLYEIVRRRAAND